MEDDNGNEKYLMNNFLFIIIISLVYILGILTVNNFSIDNLIYKFNKTILALLVLCAGIFTAVKR